MSTCKVCGKSVRKTAIAFVMSDRGLKGARVGVGCCAKDGILLVAARPQIKEVVAKGPPVATEVIRTLTAQLRALKAVHGVPDDYMCGRIEGLENAISAMRAHS